MISAAALSVGAHAAAAQRLGLRPDSLERLLTGLAPEARAAAKRYLAGNDSVARIAWRAFRFDPAAGPLLLAILAHDPSAEIRESLVVAMPFYAERWAGIPGIVPALADRVARDPSARVVTAAARAARIYTLASSGLQRALSARIATARAAGDTLLLRQLLEEDESLIHAAQPIYAPPFVRTPPAPFRIVEAARSIRFSAFGDYGVAHLGRTDTHQVEVARVLREYHARQPLDFGITTGDNFYPTSFATPSDPNWQTTWANQYDPLGIPFYISLGNHDWGEPAGPLAEYVYAQNSRSFRLPAFYYTYTAGPAQFFAINTNELTERQLAWLRDALSKSTAKWKFVYGHFPVYEQTDYTVEPQQAKVLPLLREFRVDAYFAGHHHSMQHWFVDGIDYIVAGAAGAPNYSLEDTTRAAPNRKFALSAPGFAVAEVEDGAFRLRFIGRDGAVLYEYERRK
jgi:hypothetical protein